MNSFFWHASKLADFNEIGKQLTYWQETPGTFLNKDEIALHREKTFLCPHAFHRIIGHRHEISGKTHYETEDISVFKKAAILVNAIVKERPFYSSASENEETMKCAMFANFRFAWDIVFPFLCCSIPPSQQPL